MYFMIHQIHTQNVALELSYFMVDLTKEHLQEKISLHLASMGELPAKIFEVWSLADISRDSGLAEKAIHRYVSTDITTDSKDKMQSQLITVDQTVHELAVSYHKKKRADVLKKIPLHLIIDAKCEAGIGFF